jgi:nitroimidazol reductase NimA-like FMN-containing flavoprotein (pyridoxamine 5'-phosphate oxidase superfamily)
MKPRFRKLGAARCRALLKRHHAGRIAFTFKNRVDIEPIGYVLSGQWLYCRTAVGTKLALMRRNPWVAFEVDEVEGAFDWRSVVVHGAAYFLSPEGDVHPEYDRAVRILRTIDPRILTDDDAAPARTTLFRIHIDEVTGRSASTV